MQSVSSNSLPTEHSTYNNEMTNNPNAAISTTGLPTAAGITQCQNSPTPASLISSQILGSTPLSQIGCPLPLDQYSSERKQQMCFYVLFAFYICVTVALTITLFFCFDSRPVVTLQ